MFVPVLLGGGVTALGDRVRGYSETAWPDLALDAAKFLGHLARHLPEDLSALSRVQAADLFLACACLDGNARAFEHFDRRLLGRVRTFVGKIDKSEAFADEVRQLLREKLFVGTGAAPKIADYSGSGSLEGWVRVAAIRTAQNLVRAPKPNVPLSDDQVLALHDRAPNPELEYLRARYAQDFSEVFREVLAGLPAKEKNLLVLYFLDGLRSAAIGKMYGVHAATVRRWIEAARGVLLDETRKRLRARLELDAAEFESLMGLILSQITISRCLRADVVRAEPDR